MSTQELAKVIQWERERAIRKALEWRGMRPPVDRSVAVGTHDVASAKPRLSPRSEPGSAAPC